ncbi:MULTISPECIES: type II secretion system F family protein [Streptomyces]|uniref:Type II secretion system F family protein n=2 Tax=Streptomyces TaxID=1883 RepID=A0ABU4K4A5_9ACTN|nr:type II secretion system F family protein [Streptomyces roseolus]MDX2292589.1 type II secretion system F family protein [Streptomyces roseolus]
MRSELVRSATLLLLGCWLLGRAWHRLERARRARGSRRRLDALSSAGSAGRGGPLGRSSVSRKARGAWARLTGGLREVPGPVRAAVVGGVLAAGLFLGWPAALAAGAGGVLGARWWTRRTGASRVTPDEREAVRRLPEAADLLAACASAGAGPGEAAEAVGRSMGGPLGERLLRTAAELRLGGEPAEVWGRFGAIPGAEGLARCMERAGASGAPAADAVARHAAGLRAASARTAAARARRAQVLISAPVGLCFLPAFLAVGVAPVVIGLASGLLGD